MARSRTGMSMSISEGRAAKPTDGRGERPPRVVKVAKLSVAGFPPPVACRPSLRPAQKRMHGR